MEDKIHENYILVGSERKWNTLCEWKVTALYGVATPELMHIFLSQGLVEKIMIILRNSMNWQNHERFTSKKLTKSKALIHLWPSNKHIITTNCGMNLCQLSMNVWSTKLDDFWGYHYLAFCCQLTTSENQNIGKQIFCEFFGTCTCTSISKVA